MQDIVLKLNRIFCSVIEFINIFTPTFLLQEGTSQKVVYSLWFRTSLAGYIFIHSVSPLLEFHFAATSARSKSIEAFPFSVSNLLELAPGGSSSLELMDMIIEEGRLASIFLHNISPMLVASEDLAALNKLFTRHFAGSWSSRECRPSVDCRCRSLLLSHFIESLVTLCLRS